MAANEKKNEPQSALTHFLITLAVLVVGLGIFFGQSASLNQVIFSNDGPLGVHVAASADTYPDAFRGIWSDSNWVGVDSLSANPGITSFLFMILGPIGFAKLYCPLALLLFGLSVWLFLRALKFGPTVCLLGAVAATLNGNRFSVACWGLPAWVICATGAVLALTALVYSTRGRPWLMCSLAGLGTGMAVSEGFDTGALLSLMVAAYGAFLWFNQEEKQQSGKTARTVCLRLAVVVVFAGLLSAHVLHTLVTTQIKGVAGTAQDAATKKKQWDFATQWSFPKAETLRLVIPGIYGYRLDTPAGGKYWGSVGRSADWDKTKQGIARHSGSGEYAGLLVVLLAGFAFFYSWRKAEDVYTRDERRHIWFWSGTGFICLLLAYGKHAPVFQFFYWLPYMSTIRSPLKFLHIVHFALVVLFAYGLHGLIKIGVASAKEQGVGCGQHLGKWWSGIGAFDRRWVMGLGSLVGVSLFATMAFSVKKNKFETFLGTQAIDVTSAKAIGHFAMGELTIFLILLLVATAVVLLVQSGFWGKNTGKWAGAILAVILITDFAHANRPWVKYWDYTDKYASNPVVDFLKEKPYEHRVSIPKIFQFGQNFTMMMQMYNMEWTQHLFPFNHIQTIDITQEPRTLEENQKYREAVSQFNPQTLIRLWELTNTKYILGEGGDFAQQFGTQVDQGKNRFRLHTAFNIVPKKPGVQPKLLEELTVQVATNGALGLIEFTGALPRAKLFSNWIVSTNGAGTLSRLTNAMFDPHQSVIVANEIPLPTSPGNTNGGQVSITSYGPREIGLDATAISQSVLLLNDKHSPKWKVYVDGKPAELLRCNYLMRGVLLEPGEHKVVFRFEPRAPALIITGISLVGGLVLLMIAIIPPRRRGVPEGDTPKQDSADKS
jgi:hypothetical protein